VQYSSCTLETVPPTYRKNMFDTKLQSVNQLELLDSRKIASIHL